MKNATDFTTPLFPTLVCRQCAAATEHRAIGSDVRARACMVYECRVCNSTQTLRTPPPGPVPAPILAPAPAIAATDTLVAESPPSPGGGGDSAAKAGAGAWKSRYLPEPDGGLP